MRRTLRMIRVRDDMPKIDYCVLTVAGNPTMSGGGGRKMLYLIQVKKIEVVCVINLKKHHLRGLHGGTLGRPLS